MSTIKSTRRRKKEQSEYFFDYSLLFVVLFLMGFGLIMIYSASSYEALQEFGDEMHYLKRQLIANIIGLIAMIIVANIPYHIWERFALFGCIATGILIFMVLTPLGIESHGARRWIGVPGTSFTLQPAEVAKIAIILFVASLLCKMGKKVVGFKAAAIVMSVPLIMFVLIWKVTDNLSSAIIVAGIAVAMLFVASPNYKGFLVIALVGIAFVAGYVAILVNGWDGGGFRSERILAWLDPEAAAQDKGFQTLQALYAIGSGGALGKGLGQSMQKLDFLPEAQNDMIFSIICEELGLFGAICVILMFVMLLWRMMVIANNAPDLFGALVVVGVMSQIAIQSVLNIAVVTNTVPNTGISLPFISYGGSSVIFLLIEIGIVLNVARRIQLKS